MVPTDSPKKAAPSRSRRKKPQPGDWHAADVKAALEKAGWTLRRLGDARGYTDHSNLARALYAPAPVAELIIAEALGKQPQELWPSRYENGQPKRVRPGYEPRDITAQRLGHARNREVIQP